MYLHKLALLCLIFVPFAFTFASLRSTVYHIFAFGKSPDIAKKDWKALPLWKRLFLIGVPGQCKIHVEEAKLLRILYWLTLALHAVRLLQWLGSFRAPGFDTILLCSAFIKLLLLDIPVTLCCFKTTHQDKNSPENEDSGAAESEATK